MNFLCLVFEENTPFLGSVIQNDFQKFQTSKKSKKVVQKELKLNSKPNAKRPVRKSGDVDHRRINRKEDRSARRNPKRKKDIIDSKDRFNDIPDNISEFQTESPENEVQPTDFVTA